MRHAPFGFASHYLANPFPQLSVRILGCCSHLGVSSLAFR
ncbi:hypothetical protein DFR68_102114 [Nocardia mexicana]|uniref:Uncharacterized protein n=1 Tax=Nocardia mexicana TaxID=279262 RepID=A0A370HAN6_9NOCA|nr:hypothetical protein DFR68_102114 [Nocardia mexicana]